MFAYGEHRPRALCRLGYDQSSAPNRWLASHNCVFPDRVQVRAEPLVLVDGLCLKQLRRGQPKERRRSVRLGLAFSLISAEVRDCLLRARDGAHGHSAAPSQRLSGRSFQLQQHLRHAACP
eukprot:6197566-Pleurochrysis_carterae.AAC.3